MREKIKLEFETFKKEFLELFREYMIKKTGASAEAGSLKGFYRPTMGLRELTSRMNDYTERYPEYYERISGEEWTL